MDRQAKEYVLMFNSLIEKLVREWVFNVGESIEHDWTFRGSTANDGTISAFILHIVGEYANDFYEYSGAYESYEEAVFDGLNVAMQAVLRGDCE